MRQYIKLTFIYIFSLFLFSTGFSFKEKPKENKKSPEISANVRHGRGHGHHGRGWGHGRRGHRGHGFRFRIDLGPRRDYYYREPYHEYVRVECQVFDDNDTRVREVQIGGRTLYFDSGSGRKFYFSLRPGYHTIKWRVSNDSYFGSKYRNYSKSLRVHRDQDQIFITIRGSNISISE